MKRNDMDRHKGQKRRCGAGNMALWLAAVLFCLVVLTTYLSAGLFARYVTRDEGGDDARVAKFDVSCAQVGETPFSIELDFLDPAKSRADISFSVVSAGEVALAYDIVAHLPETMALWVKDGLITVQLDNEKAPVAADFAAGTLTFEGKTFAAGEAGANHTLTFTVSQTDMPDSEENVTGEMILRIRAVQID